MGVATAGGYICPACDHGTLVVSRSMFDLKPLYAFCSWMESEPCLSGARLNLRPIVGQRVVPENVFFFYDKLKDARCIHDISVYAPCGECPQNDEIAPLPEE